MTTGPASTTIRPFLARIRRILPGEFFDVTFDSTLARDAGAHKREFALYPTRIGETDAYALCVTDDQVTLLEISHQRAHGTRRAFRVDDDRRIHPLALNPYPLVINVNIGRVVRRAVEARLGQPRLA